MSEARPLLAGKTIGVLGGGQLGRMLAQAVKRLGGRIRVYEPQAQCPAGAVADQEVNAAYEDIAALSAFARTCDVVTYEFENVPVAPLKALGDKLRPSVRSLEIAQDRAEEKSFIESCGARVAPWSPVASLDDVRSAIAQLSTPLVLKSRRYGYDGKGQAWLRSPADGEAAWESIGGEPAIIEAAIDFSAEFSVILARWADGRHVFWDSPENLHGDGILRRSTVPCSPIVAGQVEEARTAALRIAEALGHVGVLTVEFFASGDGPIVNEIAPRVHNSGHWTIEGSVTSQFEQHVRAICGLPPGLTGLMRGGAVMENLIGSDVERWPELVAERGAHVHIYGKGEARPGRKTGHVTRVTR